MRKNGLEILLVLGISLTSINEAAADTEASVVSTAGTITAVSSETEKLSDYFIVETPALREARQAKLTEWRQELRNRVSKLDKIVLGMADDGVVTNGEFFELEKALQSYDNFLSAVNKELVFYWLSLPEDERVKMYRKLLMTKKYPSRGDNQNKLIKRFFFNLTGKDVKVKVEEQDKAGWVVVPLAIFALLLTVAF